MITFSLLPKMLVWDLWDRGTPTSIPRQNADLLFLLGIPPRLVEEIFKKQYPATWQRT